MFSIIKKLFKREKNNTNTDIRNYINTNPFYKLYQ